MDFVEICNVCTRKVIIKDAKRIFNSDKICGSYCDFYFGVTFFGTHCICHKYMYSDVDYAKCRPMPKLHHFAIMLSILYTPMHMLTKDGLHSLIFVL